MANPVGFSPTSLIAPDLQTQLLANQRRQQLAQMLREQAIQPEQTQEVSGRVVPYGIGQGLTKLAQALMARRAQSSADAQMSDLNKEYAARYASALARTVPGSQDNVLSTGQLNPDGSNPGTVGPTVQNAAQVDPASSSLADAAKAAAMMGNTDLADKLTVQAWQQQAPTDQVKTYRQLGVPMDLAKAATERELQSKGLSNTAQLVQELNAAAPGEQDPFAMALGLKPNAEQNLQNAQRNREIANQERQTFYETGMGPGQAPAQPANGMTPKQQAELTAERIKSKPQDLAAYQSVSRSIDTAISGLDELLNDKEGIARITGPIYGRTPNLTATGTNAQANLDTLKAQIGVQTINAMREASKTGGAVGNVTEQEWPILQNQLGALQQSQTTDQFLRHLTEIRTTLSRVKAAAGEKFKNTYGEFPDVQSPTAGKVRRYNPATGKIE